MKLKVVEMFQSLQGEGAHCGEPMFFIRLYGCTRRCSFCDTKYHEERFIDAKVDDVVSAIQGKPAVCFTGGEPLLQGDVLRPLMSRIIGMSEFHLETNGDLLKASDFRLFDYISISPKDEEGLMNTMTVLRDASVRRWARHDVKVVTDGSSINKEMLSKATMLMPLTTGDLKKDAETRKRVWELCVATGLRYSPRLHTEVWGQMRGV